MTTIPFNRPYLTGDEQANIIQALQSRNHCGNHAWGMKCIELMKAQCGFQEVFLTPSGTAALEMGAMLAGLECGDEVILPSYTFSSTANAVLLQGARPVFCEIEPNTMSLDPEHIESLVNERTRMVLPIDYAGIPCDIERIKAIADKHALMVMVDAAQSYFASDAQGRFCGNATPLAAFSFHETKNLGCGEGGALVVNRPDWVERAHFLQEKGTDRQLVLNGVRNKYGWVDKGSSFLLSDMLAAMLYAQLLHVEEIVALRSRVTSGYSALFRSYEKVGCLRIPHPPPNVRANHHAFFVIFDTSAHQCAFLSALREYRIHAYIGYVPLHSFTMGRRLGYHAEDLPVTEDLASRIVRLPFYTDLGVNGLEYVLESMQSVLKTLYGF